MANYTDRLTGNPKILIEQNIYDSAELLSFSPMNTMSDGREVPTLLCCYTDVAEDRHYYSLRAGTVTELEGQGFRVVGHDLPCLVLKTAKARRNGILELVLADIQTAETMEE